MQPRSEKWKDLDDSTVLRLVVSDLDGMESSIDDLRDTIDTRLGSLSKTMVGILVAVSTAAIMLAANLAVG